MPIASYSRSALRLAPLRAATSPARSPLSHAWKGKPGPPGPGQEPPPRIPDVTLPGLGTAHVGWRRTNHTTSLGPVLRPEIAAISMSGTSFRWP